MDLIIKLVYIGLCILWRSGAGVEQISHSDMPRCRAVCQPTNLTRFKQTAGDDESYPANAYETEVTSIAARATGPYIILRGSYG